MSIPGEAADFSVAWLNQVLSKRGHLKGARVVGCDVRESDNPGQTAEIFLLRVTYDRDEPQCPQQLVAKVTSRNPVVLDEVIANFDQYRRETAFYNQIADPGIGVPRCLHAEHDPDSQRFVLLMHDLAPAESPSWGIAPDQVADATSQLPAFHAQWWNDPLLKTRDWIVQPDDASFFGRAFGGAHQAHEQLAMIYHDAEPTNQIMAAAAGKIDGLLAFMSSRPHTLVHGDYHAKQMFFPTPEGGQFAVIDWQFPFVAAGPWDLARIVGLCLSSEERLRRERGLIDDYRAGLVEHGVRDYSDDEFATDYRFGLAVSQMIMCIASVSTDLDLLRVECESFGLDWRDVMFERNQRALQEWDVLALIESI